MCEYCSQKPRFYYDDPEEFNYIDYESQKELISSDYTALYIGADAKGKIVLRTSGDDCVDFHPNYCPICGRDLRCEK